MPRFTALDLFKGVSEEEMRRIVRYCGERRYARGATIFSEGDPADAMFIVADGLVKLVSVSGKGAETTLHILKPGEIFGELFYAEERRAFDAVTTTDAVVTVIPRKVFEEILSSFPGVARNFVRLLSRRLVKIEKGYAGFGHTWSYQRLGQVLLQLGKDHGVRTGGGTLIAMRLTHEDLARLIGTTRETVTTQISRFKRMGLVRREKGRFILNEERLRNYISPPEA